MRQNPSKSLLNSYGANKKCVIESHSTRSRAFLILFIVFFWAITLDAQPCNGFRYLFQIFSNSTVTSGIQYGSNTTIGGASQDLFMDIYEAEGDTASSVALVILVHPGVTGEYSKEDMSAIGHNLAQRGFVVASIDYRPLDLDLGSGLTEDEFFEWLHGASSDLKAAIRYLRELRDNGNPYGMSPLNIFPLGLGAGALIVDQAAYLDPNDALSASRLSIVNSNGGFEGDSNDINSYSSDPRAVISCSGALLEADWIDNGEPFLSAIHDDADPTIPYGNGDFLLNDGATIAASVQGSSTMVERAMNVNLYHVSSTIPSSTEHLSYWTPGGLLDSEILDGSCSYLYDIMCNGVASSVVDFEGIEILNVYPNPAREFLVVECDLEFLGEELRVYDLMGKLVLRDRVDKMRMSVDLSSLDMGVYLIQIGDAFSDRIRFTKN